MSKNLINSAGDFLHLYLGCPVLVTPYEGASYECKLCGVSIEKVGGETEVKVQVFEDDGPDGYEGHGHKWFDADEVELILRKIETMTDEECIAVGEIAIGTYDSVKFRVEKKLTSSEKFAFWKVHKEHRGYGKSLTIDEVGEIDVYDRHDDGTHTIYMNQHFVTMYLLSRGFDLHRLIDSGFAIDSTERVGVN